MKVIKIDKNNYVEIFREYNVLIFRYIYSRVGNNKELAQDLTQEVFLKVWKKKESFNENKGSIKTWLFRIAQNTLIDEYRSKYSNLIENDEEKIINFVENRENEDFEMMLNFVLQKMKNLSESDQEILTMKFVAQLENNEIADVLEKSENTIKVQIHRALNKLKEIING